MQQINLYLPELRPRTNWLSLSTLVFVCVFAVVCMVGFYVYGMHHQAKFLFEIEAIEAEQQHHNARVSQLQTSVHPVNSAQLDARIGELEQHIQHRLALGRVIEGQNLGNTQGYSAALNAMARLSLTSISLERIRFSSGAKIIEFSGLCSTADDVPLYLRSLQRQEAFSGSQFGLLSLSELSSNNLLAAAKIYTFSVGFDDVFKQKTLLEKRRTGDQP